MLLVTLVTCLLLFLVLKPGLINFNMDIYLCSTEWMIKHHPVERICFP